MAGERLRRATRQCLVAAAAVRGALQDAGLPETALAGAGTGVLYVTATAYAGANRAFLEDEGATTLHFPYTAPSAVPGEVTIEFGIRGPYVNLTGGGTAALHALWYAARWLSDGDAERVLVLGVEAVHEVWDLSGRARRLYDPPLVESAACLLLEPGPGPELVWASATIWDRCPEAAVGAVLDAVVAGPAPRLIAAGGGARGLGRAERAALARRGWAGAAVSPPGEALACGPLIGLARTRARGETGPVLLTTGWRNAYGAMLWPMAA
jgi:hypothetical protein